MLRFNNYTQLTEASKAWAGFDDLPSRMDRNLSAFFKALKSQLKDSVVDIYINDKEKGTTKPYNFVRADKVLQIKCTDKTLPEKISKMSAMKKYDFQQSGANFVSKDLIKVSLEPSGGMRGSGRLPRIGQVDAVPSNAQQEMGTIVYFEGARNNKKPLLAEISEKVGFNFGEDWMYNYEQQYIAYVKGMGVPKGNIYLDSEKNESDTIVRVAKKLGLKDDKDNWNPADIWIMNGITGSKIESDTKDFVNLAEYNGYLEEKFESKEIIGVSLKKIDKPKKGKFEIVKAVDLPVVDLDTGTTLFNPYATNFIFMTSGDPTGYQIRVGYKAGTIQKDSDIRIYLEGRMKGTNVQLGAVSAIAFRDIAKGKGFDIVKDRAEVLKNPVGFLKKELPIILRNSKVTDKSEDMPQDEMRIKSGAFLTYFMKLMLALDEDDLKSCYFSSIKKNEFSSIHAKVYA